MSDTAPRPTPPPTHPCPGRCGRAVVNRLFACPPCWGRLPRDQQRAITRAVRGTYEHAAAMVQAGRWYGDQAVSR